LTQNSVLETHRSWKEH